MRFVTAAQQPIYMYHGTSARHLSGILSSGLITDPKDKVWKVDPDARFNFPSRASVGGIYFTRNLRTAVASANTAVKKNPHTENRIIVIAQIMPGSLVMDEDSLPGSLHAVRFPEAIPSENLSCQLWGCVVSGQCQSDVDRAKELYITTNIDRIKFGLLDGLDSRLEARLRELLDGGFEIALRRQISHVNPTDYKYWVGRVINLDQQELPERPSVTGAEEEYRKYMDRVTRVLRRIALMEILHDTSGLRSGRVLEGVGYSGGNKVVGIIKLSPLYVRNYDIEVVYEPEGGMPEEAWNQFLSQYRVDESGNFKIINKK